MTIKRSNFLTGLALAALVTTTPVHAADKIAKIGVLAPLTGAFAAEGTEMVNGAKLAVDELNAAGGVAGYKLEAVVADVQNGSADAVTTAIERLIGDRDVNAVVTGYASASSFEIEMLAEHNMPYLLEGNSNATRDIIAPHPEKFPTVWEANGSFDPYNTELVSVLQGLEASGKLKLPNKKVALIASDNPYSKIIMNGLKKTFGNAGWTVTSADVVPFGEINDWRTFFVKVRQDNPSIIIDTDYPVANAAKFLTQFLEQPTDSLVYIQFAPSIPEFLKITGNKATGVIYSVIAGAMNSPKNTRAIEIYNKFRDKYGVEPGTTGPAVYEEVMLYADALKKVGDPTKRLEIGKAIGETHKQTAGGILTFDPKTHLAVQGEDGYPIQFFQIWDGKHVMFDPKKYADGEFRMPPWMKQ